MSSPNHSREGFTLVEIMIVVGIIALLAALAVPMWQKIRLRAIYSVMDNDARQLAAAAQQYFMENSTATVVVGYVEGVITGPLKDHVQFIGRGYSSVTDPLTVSENFTMSHPSIPDVRTYSPEGQFVP